LSIWLTRLAIDRWRLVEGLAEGQGADAVPLALISDTAHGPRITAVNAAGLAAGVRHGTMLMDARTLCPALAAVPADYGGDRAFLEKLAIWAQRWAPGTAMDLPDGLFVDVTGTAHLFGDEVMLLADVRQALGCHRLAARFAIAPTAGAAWALTHYGPNAAILEPDDDIVSRLADLPVAALRLDEATVLLLRRLGLKRLGELGDVGREALMRRFRRFTTPDANPVIRLDQLTGRLPEPLVPVVAVELPLVQRRLVEPIRHRELLNRVVVDLAADMARLLEAGAQGARRLELGMWKVDGEVVIRRLEPAAPTRDAAHIVRLFGEKLGDVDAGFGIEVLRLRASWTEPLALTQSDIEATAEEHGTSLSACIDRLSVRLGADAVRRPVPHASHIPERAQRWQPPLEPQSATQGTLVFPARPLKLLDRPEPIAVIYESPDGLPRRFRWRDAVHEVTRVEGPERIAPEWWRERSTVRLRDYYRVEDVEGRRYWIYRAGIVGDRRGGVPGWFLQGLYG
jgi:protein ImuB